MSMVIVEDCISCGACEPDCPNEAIGQNDTIYVIDPAKCTECIGAFDQPKCVELCPVENCIVPNPAHAETREQLEAKYQKLHA